MSPKTKAALIGATLVVLCLPAQRAEAQLPGFCGAPTGPRRPRQSPTPPSCSRGGGGGGGAGAGGASQRSQGMGGGGAGGGSCNNCTGSPCYVGSGVYAISETDLEIPTNGFPLLLARSYESTRAIDGPLGYGWTSNLTARAYSAVYLLAAPDTVQREVDVTMPGGLRYRFQENADGSYTPPVGRYDRLVKNGDGTFDLTFANSRSVLHFAQGGSLLSMSDDFGNTLQYTYDGNGRLQRVDDLSGSGRYLDVFWGADGRLSTIRDHTGRQVGYFYNGRGALATVTDPLGRQTHYTYVQGRYAPLLATVKDNWDRLVTEVTYEASDRVRSYTENGETWTFTYVYQGNPLRTAKADSQGNTWVFTFLPSGLITDREPPAGSGGGTVHTDYNADGSVRLRIDEVGVKTYFTYDTQANVLSRTDDYQGSLAVRWDYTYDPAFAGRITSITPRNPVTGQVDPHWQARRYDYNQAGSPVPGSLHHIYSVRVDGATVDTEATYAYDDRGRLASSTGADGVVTQYLYDAAGNLASVSLPPNNDLGIGPSITFGYDALGRTVSVTNAMGSQTTYTLDAIGCLLTATLPPPAAGSSLDFTTANSYDEYDAPSGLTFTSSRDPNGAVTRRGFDAFGRLVARVDELGAVTSYGYAGDVLSSVTDPNAYTTQFTYNALRRPIQKLTPDGLQEIYSYHADGLPRAHTDRNGRAIIRAYDGHKRLTSRTYPDSTSVSFAYLGQKLLTVTDTSTDPPETHSFSYDTRYRVASEVQGPRGTLEYTYTTAGRWSGFQIPGGERAAYSYYPDGSLKAIDWSPAGLFEFRYGQNGEVQQLIFPNGQRREYMYDDQGRLVKVANVSAASVNLATYFYQYDIDNSAGLPGLLGQRARMTANVPTQGLVDATTKYYYDRSYRLTGADYPQASPFLGTVARWGYDPSGNRTTSSVNGESRTLTYQRLGGSAQNWSRLLSDGVSSYTYDGNGNMTGIADGTSTLALSWDFEDRLTSLSGTGAFQYSYDYLGRRTKRVGADGTSTFLYVGLDLVRESGAEVVDYVFGPYVDEPLALSVGSSVSYLSIDGLGSVVAANDSSGAVTGGGMFDAWGQTIESQGFTGRFGYTAREPSDSGLMFYRHRYYLPSIGRFASEDPIDRWFTPLRATSASPDPTSTAGSNPFPYAGNRPTAVIDPLGLYVIRPQEGPTEITYGNAGEFQSDRVDLAGTCYCCGGGQWCASFEVVPQYHFFEYPGGTQQCTKRHENGHLNIFLRWVERLGDAVLLPVEKKTFPTQESCEAALAAARLAFFDLFRRRHSNHHDAQDRYDDGMFFWDAVMCGPWNK